MSIINNIAKLKKLDRLIRFGITGSPNDLAEKMEVSRATIFRTIERLKTEFDAPIYFDKSINSYYYEVPGQLILRFVAKEEEDVANG